MLYTKEATISKEDVIIDAEFTVIQDNNKTYQQSHFDYDRDEKLNDIFIDLRDYLNKSFKLQEAYKREENTRKIVGGIVACTAIGVSIYALMKN